MSTHVSSEAGAARVSLYADQNFYPQLVASHLQKSMAKDQSRAELHGDEKEPRLGFADSQLSSDDAKAHPSSQIERLTRGDIASLIEQHRGSADLFTFVKAVLEASSPADSAGLDRTLWIFEAVMTQLGDGAEIARRDDILGNLLLARANSLPDRVIAYLAQQAYHCVHGVALSPNATRQAVEGAFELLTKLVFRLKGAAPGLVDPDSRCRHDYTHMNGEGYRSHVIAKICQERWKESAMVAVVSSLRDMASGLAAADAEAIRGKVVTFIRQVPANDLPAFLFETLLLSARLNMREEMSTAFFAHLEERESSLQVGVQGQLLSQFNLVVSQDAQLGALFVKSLEDANRALTQSRLCFLLSMGRVKRFQSRVIDLVKRRALAQAKLDARVRASSFLSAALGRQPREDMLPALLALCDQAHAGGWDLLVPVLLELGVKLAETLPESTDRWTHPAHDLAASTTSSAEAAVAGMGVEVIAKCFQLFALERGEILAQITSRALVARGHPVQFVRVLHKVAAEPSMYDMGPAIKELASLVPCMAPRVAHAVLRAMDALLSARRDLRDHVMIVLRKAMFQRDVEPRINALFGLLAVHAACRSEDVVGALCRAAGNQSDVRHAMYAGLSALVSGNDGGAIVDSVLASQREKYFDHELADKGWSPYDFSEAIDPATGRIVEPMAGLVKLSPLEWARVEKLSAGDLAMFNLSSSSNFDPATTQGAVNLSMVTLVVTTCEALIDKLVDAEPGTKASNSSRALAQVAGLFNLSMAARKLVRQKTLGHDGAADASGAGDKKGKKGAKKAKTRNDNGDDDDDAENQPATSSLKKTKKTKQVDDDDADADAGAEVNKKPKRAKSSAAAAAASAQSPVVPVGLELSNATIIKLLSMLAPAAEPPLKTSAHDIEYLMADARSGFADYVLVAATARTADAMRIYGGAEGKVPKADPDARREWAEMAQLCAGALPAPIDVDALTPVFWRLLRASIKIDRLEAEDASKDDKKKKSTKFYQQLQTHCLEGLLMAFKAASRVSVSKVASAAAAMFPKKASSLAESLHVAAQGLHEVIDSYVLKQMNRNAILALHVFDVLLAAMPTGSPALKDHVEFALSLCKYQVPSMVCRELVEFVVDWSARHDADAGFKRACETLAASCRRLIVTDDDDAPADSASEPLRMVTSGTLDVVIKALLASLHAALDECTCVVDVMRAAARGVDEEQACAIERAAFGRFAVVADVLQTLVAKPCNVGVVRAAGGLFKAMTRALKEAAAARRVVDVGSVKTMLAAAHELSSELYSNIEEQSSDDAAVKAAAELVYNVEMYDVACVKLAKVVPSIDHIIKQQGLRKMRDFKITLTSADDEAPGGKKSGKKRKAAAREGGNGDDAPEAEAVAEVEAEAEEQ